MESDEIKNYLGGLSNSTRVDKEQMNQMALTNRGENSTRQANDRVNCEGDKSHKVVNIEEH